LTGILNCSFGEIKQHLNFMTGTTYGVRHNVQENLAKQLAEYLDLFQSSRKFDDKSNESRLQQFKIFVKEVSENLYTALAHICRGQ
jgi:hypothetical protein